MKDSYFNNNDGHTYYLKVVDHEVVLYACPTMQNGELDIENELPVSEFNEPLAPREVDRIINYLIS
jgi:hypothetical protein